MSIITISRGSYSKGREIAEKIAQRMHYQCISRDVLLEASENFNIPEIKLIRAIENAPSILDRLTYGKEKYINFIQVALLRQLQKDNMVYHGLAGHFFVRDIPHVLKVRIIASMKDRVRLEMDRERIPENKALSILKNDDEQRRKWSIHLYGIDTNDPSLYDLVIHVGKVSTDDAVDIIFNTVNMKCFQTTPQSQKAMDDLLLTAEVRAALTEVISNVDITADAGTISLRSKDLQSKDAASLQEIEKIVSQVPGVREIKMLVPSQKGYSNPWHKI